MSHILQYVQREIYAVIRGEAGDATPAPPRTPPTAAAGRGGGGGGGGAAGFVSLTRPEAGKDVRKFLADALRWRLNHALRNPGCSLTDHWPRSSLRGDDTRYGSQQWTQWYIETLRILDCQTPQLKIVPRLKKNIANLREITGPSRTSKTVK